jgi:hypothetical protein
MNRVWGLTAAAAVAVGGAAIAGDPPAGPRQADARPWYGRVLGGDAKAKDERAKKAPEEPAAKPTPRRPSVIIAPLAPDVLAEAVRAEEQACTRRLDVCARLRQAAAEKNDEALLGRIDELERQAIELCQARVARLGVRGTAGRPSARAALDKDLGTGAAVDPLAVAPPAPAARPATAEARGVRP